MSEARLQKLLASAGVASRRAAEELITAGRVRVNGRVIRELGAKADLRRDKITVDGKTLVRERHVYYLLHKPRGTVTTLDDPEGRPTVMEILKGVPERIFPVGRLDWNTAGALLLTNDGDLTQALTHPRRKVIKTYAVKLQGHPSDETLERWREGVELEDGRTAPADVWMLSVGPNTTYLRVAIREGRNRQIHRMGEATGHAVLRLTRTDFAGLGVDDLRPGEYRPLTAAEVDDLRQAHVLGVPPGPARRGRPAPRAPRSDDRPPKFEGRGPRPVRPEPPIDPRPTTFARPKRRPAAPARGPRTDDRATAFARSAPARPKTGKGPRSSSPRKTRKHEA
jgi:23S rRNA pseudouridine2605 synthase